MTLKGRPPAAGGPGEERADLLAGLLGLVEPTRDMVIVIDDRGTIVWANWVTEQALGHDLSAKAGTSVLDLVHPRDAARARAGLDRLTSGREAIAPVLIRARRADGTYLLLEVRATNLLDEPSVKGVVLMARDLSGRQHLERRRHELEHSFTAAFRHSPVGRTLVDLQGRWLLVNEAFARMVGRDAGGLIGTRGSDVFHPDDRDRIRSELADLAAGVADSRTVETRFIRPDGEIVWVRFTVWLVFDDDGQPTHFGSDATDITEVRAARDAEDRARRGFETLVERSSEIITVLEADGTWRSSSGAGSRLLGYEKGFDPGGGVLALLHPDDVEAAGVALDEVRHGTRGANDPLVVRVKAADGSYHALETVGQDLTADPAVRGIVLSSRDVTERVESEATLHEVQARFAALVEHASDLITVNDLEGTITYVSPSSSRLLGYEPDALVGTQARDLIHPDDVAGVEHAATEQFAQKRVEPIEYRARHRDGSWRVFDATVTDLLREPSVQGVVTNARDVTERRAAERRAADLVEILEAATELVVVSDPNGRIVFANRTARTLLGAREQRHVGELSSDRSRERLRTEIMPVVRQRGAWSGELELVDPERRLIPVTATVQAQRDDNGDVVRVATVAHDISDLKAAQRRLEFEATHDALTGLPNRALFREIGDRAVARANRSSESLAVLFLDLDGFKLVNDGYGHDTGDVLLGQVARRLREAVRAGDVVARLGGDEFVILCEQPRNESQMLDLSARIIETVSLPFIIADHTVRVGVSVGIAFSKGADVAIGALIRDADVALYRAKNEGRGRAQLFDETLLG